jgi:hypothetical protein
MALYEVQEFCLCGGWTNTWSHTQDGSDEPTQFTSREGAQEELDWFLADMIWEHAEGNIADVPDRKDFRIVRVDGEEEELEWIEKTSRLASAKTENEVEAIIAQHKK